MSKPDAYSMILLKTREFFIGLKQFVNAIAPACFNSDIELSLSPSKFLVSPAKILTSHKSTFLKIS